MQYWTIGDCLVCSLPICYLTYNTVDALGVLHPKKKYSRYNFSAHVAQSSSSWSWMHSCMHTCNERSNEIRIHVTLCSRLLFADRFDLQMFFTSKNIALLISRFNTTVCLLSAPGYLHQGFALGHQFDMCFFCRCNLFYWGLFISISFEKSPDVTLPKRYYGIRAGEEDVVSLCVIWGKSPSSEIKNREGAGTEKDARR